MPAGLQRPRRVTREGAQAADATIDARWRPRRRRRGAPATPRASACARQGVAYVEPAGPHCRHTHCAEWRRRRRIRAVRRFAGRPAARRERCARPARRPRTCASGGATRGRLRRCARARNAVRAWPATARRRRRGARQPGPDVRGAPHRAGHRGRRPGAGAAAGRCRRARSADRGDRHARDHRASPVRRRADRDPGHRTRAPGAGGRRCRGGGPAHARGQGRGSRLSCGR